MLLAGIVLFVRGLGLGALLVPAMTAVYVGLDRKDIPQGTTSTRMFQQIGGAFGVAALTMILSRRVALLDTVDVFPAYSEIFLWSSVFTALSLVPALLLGGKK